MNPSTLASSQEPSAPSSIGCSLTVLVEFQPGDGAAMDLVGAVGEPQGANRRISARQPGILRYACAAERLDRVVDDFQCHLRRGDLDHCDLALSRLVARAV